MEEINYNGKRDSVYTQGRIAKDGCYAAVLRELLEGPDRAGREGNARPTG